MKIYIGHDSRQPEATDVCEYSIHKYTKYPVHTERLDITELKNSGIYYRPDGSPASTEFTYTRFLVPYLNNHEEWATFVDSDFLFTDDITNMWDDLMCNPRMDDYAVFCVKHLPYVPSNKTKFWGNIQHNFPRKNWSSLMVFNGRHSSTKKLTPLTVANQSPEWLHRFGWCKDSEIGSIRIHWNWLVGDYGIPDLMTPKALHYTNGGPWNDVWGQHYDADWLAMYLEMTGYPFQHKHG